MNNSTRACDMANTVARSARFSKGHNAGLLASYGESN